MLHTQRDDSPTTTLRWLAARPWEDVTLPDAVRDVPTMISCDERALLYVLARDYYSVAGKIVDAGCFLGGSTVALAQGVLDRNTLPADRVIDTYDLFRLDDGSYTHYAHMLDGLSPGDSLRETFEKFVGDRRALVNVREGDIRQQRWTDGPIEVLFIDVAKNWSINDHVTRTFFPALIPGQSVVIQQDYVHEWTPWLPITMELLGDAFAPGGTVPFASAIFVPQRNIRVEEIPTDLYRDVPHSTKLALYDRATQRFNGEEQGVLECGRAYLLHLLGDSVAAHTQLDTVERKYTGPRMEVILPDMRRFLAAHGSAVR